MAAAAAVPPGGRPHGMLSVVGLGDADLERLCDEARQQLGGDTVCQLANYLFPQVGWKTHLQTLRCFDASVNG
jgi:[acyl-carrier-protein] S-malonyltransferase